MADNGAIGLALVDDQELVRLGLSAIVAAEDDCSVVISSAHPNDALQDDRLDDVDVALVDARMPEMSGAEFIARLAQTHPDISCIMLTAFDEDASLLDCIQAGGRGHLLKDASGDDIVAAIRTVAGGGMAFGASEMERMAGLLAQRQRREQSGVLNSSHGEPAETQIAAVHPAAIEAAESAERTAAPSRSERQRVLAQLSEEDRRIADMAAQGVTNREIAQRLFMSVGTVRNHLSAVFAKVGVRNRTELAVLLHG